MDNRLLRRLQEADNDVHIDLTAMVDVVFLLLIFFLLGTTLKSQADLAIELPSVDQGATKDAPVVDELAITAEGGFIWKGQPLSVLPDKVELGPTGQVRLLADRATRHEKVVQALELVQRSGAKGVVIEALSAGTAGAGK